jgi:hypothetical protein
MRLSIVNLSKPEYETERIVKIGVSGLSPNCLFCAKRTKLLGLYFVSQSYYILLIILSTLKRRRTNLLKIHFYLKRITEFLGARLLIVLLPHSLIPVNIFFSLMSRFQIDAQGIPFIRKMEYTAITIGKNGHDEIF